MSYDRTQGSITCAPYKVEHCTKFMIIFKRDEVFGNHFCK